MIVSISHYIILEQILVSIKPELKFLNDTSEHKTAVYHSVKAVLNNASLPSIPGTNIALTSQFHTWGSSWFPVIQLYTLTPWKPGKIWNNLKSECPPAEMILNIYKGAGRHLLRLRKAFSSLWGRVSLLSTLFLLLTASGRVKGLHSLGQRQVALYLNHLVTLFSAWLASQSNHQSSWQSLAGNESGF